MNIVRKFLSTVELWRLTSDWFVIHVSCRYTGILDRVLSYSSYTKAQEETSKA